MPVKPRGRPREITAEELRAIALDLFTDLGYDQTSLSQIARVAGVSRTTLFGHYPAKRDFMWVDDDLRRARLEQMLAEVDDEPISATIERALLTLANYTRDEHAVLAHRYRIVASSAELRAYSSLRVTEMTELIATWAARRRPQIDIALVRRVTNAWVGASAEIIDEWARDPAPASDLSPYLRERLQPFVTALAPMLDERSASPKP